jgi:excisionase family DNA binding protein
MLPLSKPNAFEPLVVSPRDACTLLGIGNTRLYAILKSGELESYHDGSARRITLASIQKYIADRIDADTGKRRRGRPPGSKNKKSEPLTAVTGQPEVPTGAST